METADNARRLAAVDAQAAALGAAPGQTVADAIALNPALVILEAEPAADAAALEALADWCLRFSPLVAVDPPDGLFLDIAGCAHLWGGEEELTRTLIARLAADGIPARVGIAPTFGAAWALARFGDASSRHPRASLGESRGETRGPRRLAVTFSGSSGLRAPDQVQGAPPEDDGKSSFGNLLSILAPLPVAALRLEPETADQLRRLGLKTVGDVAKLPRAALARRFGDALTRRLAQALGEADEPLTFRRPPSPWIERRLFADPISAPEDFARTLDGLAHRLCARLERDGQGARRFEAVFHRVDGAAAHREASAARPARDAKRLLALFADKLETLDPGFGVEVVTLQAHGVEPMRGVQTDLVDAARDARDLDLAPLIDRLRNRFGAERVWRAAPHESHVPERAVARIAPLAPARGQGWDLGRPRPIRLLRSPEPIEAVAPIPDDPPVLFRWRGRTHRVRAAEGPERIGAEWWRESWARRGVDRVRDYYRVEDEEGARFWVFRRGLYGAEEPPRWWLHGVFA